MTKGVIDIGSNSVRLMVLGANKSKRLVTTSLGRGLQKTGRLGKTEMEDTLNAIADFIKGLDVIYLFATEAVRVATNSKEFCDAIYDRFGLKVDILSKQEEAQAGYLGAVGNKIASVIDIGGASTEFATGGDSLVSLSIPLGAVRLTDMSIDGIDTDTHIESILPEFDFNREVYGIGGTITSVATMVLDLDTYQVDKVHGYKLTSGKINQLYKDILDLDGAQIYSRYPVIGQKRALVIKEGVHLLTKIISHYNIDTIIVSDSDNTEGYLLLRNL